ncbi:hypothetical protein DID88_001847 [Monilinia fructigena]|uniref:COP9 signalosome complex subunit 3 n=1 Tax=Monilinia fructigena TaxID=38457 RepID=A0A395IW47_9HELO|nr:hypothetical protein DID88_001847 [Monilinia fructigena]
MDNILPSILSFPPHPAPLVPLSDSQYDAGIKSQIETLKKTPEKILLQSTTGGESPLDVINPSLNTVPYIYILNAHIAAAHKMRVIFDGRQIRYLGRQLLEVLNFVSQFASQNRTLFAAIPALREAVLRIDPSGSVLTSNHLYIVRIFETGSASRLKGEFEHGRTLWNEDATTGLMLNVLGAYQKFQIRNLANVYLRIGAVDVMSLTTSAETGAKLTSVKQIEDLMQSMIADGTLPATLIRDQSGQTVLTFSPAGHVLSETQVQRELLASTQRIQSLARQIKVTDRILTHDKRYIESAQKAKSKAKSPGVQGEVMDWYAANDDEDLMTEMY